MPDKAIRGHNKRLPQNISLVGESDLSTLILNKGPIDFICGGWECQSMSMAGKHKGMDDDRFTPVLDMVRTLNFLQKNQISPPLYLFENTYPGTPGQYPCVDEAAKMVESFLGAPVVIDAAGLGSVAHRVRLFWTNWCPPEQLQDAIPQNLPPTPSLAAILHPDHVPTVPGHDPIYPFAKLNEVGKPRKCMPTIVSFPRSHAYRKKDNGLPGEGQLWNKRMKRWDEPSLMEREQMMGYKPDATYAGLATIAERAERLGRAMDANTMRWLGAFLHATQIDTNTSSSIPNSSLGGGFSIRKSIETRQMTPESVSLESMQDHHHQACAVVENLIKAETQVPTKGLGGVIHKTRRELRHKKDQNQQNRSITSQRTRTPKNSPKFLHPQGGK